MKKFLFAYTDYSNSEHHQIEIYGESKGAAYHNFRKCYPDTKNIVVNYIIPIE